MFFYREGYEMDVAEAAKNLILARDKYLEAFFAYYDLEGYGMCAIEEELDSMKSMMQIVLEEKSKTNIE